MNAELILTAPEKNMADAVEIFKEILLESDNIIVPAQFENYDNGMSHYLSIGPEIYKKDRRYIKP